MDTRKSYKIKRKSDGKYLFVKWNLTTIVSFCFTKESNATIFNAPTDQNPMNISLLRGRGLSFFFMEVNMDTSNLEKEECEFREEELFDENDNKRFEQEIREIEKEFPNFFEKK